MRNRCLLMSILTLVSSVVLATSGPFRRSGGFQLSIKAVSLKPQMLVQFGGFGNHKLYAGDMDRRSWHHHFFAKSQPGGATPIPSGIQNFWEWLG